MASSSVGVQTLRSQLGPSVLRRWQYSNEAVLFVLVLLAIQLFSRGMNAGIYGQGIVSGAGLALQAIGVVLVYRSNRIINFAQAQIGMTAAAIFTILVVFFPLLRYTHDLAPPLLGRYTSLDFEIDYWISLLIALGLSVLFAWLAYLVIVRFFGNAPRLIVTVATIFLAQALPFFADSALRLFLTGAQKRSLAGSVQVPRVALQPPFDFTVRISGILFHAADVLTVVIAALASVGLFVYLRSSATGTAIRASSENPARAGTLGVNVSGVTTRVWLFAGLLSGVGALLSAMQTGVSNGIDPGAMVAMLFVAVLARFTNLPLALMGALVVGVLEQAILTTYHSITPFYGSLVVLIGVGMLVQRSRISRAELEQASSFQAVREVRPIPEEMRSLPTVRKWLGIGLAAVVVVVVGGPWAMSPLQLNLAGVAFVYVMVGLSLLILTGWAGQISLGQFAFAALGAWIAAASHLPFLIAVLAGAFGGSLVAVLVGIPALRLRGLQLAVISLAFALAAGYVLLDPNYWGKALPVSIGRPKLLGVSFADDKAYYYLTLLFLVLVVIGVVGLRRSRTGRVLIAARDNDLATQSFGVSVTRARLTAFAFSGFVAALAGALFAYQEHAVNAADFAPMVSLNIFLYTVIGGLGGVSGPIIGGIYYWLLTMSGATPFIEEFGTGLGGLAVLMVFPGGVAAGLFQVRDAVLRRIASRNRMVVPSLFSDRDPRRVSDSAPIMPKRGAGGSTAFVPARYTLDDQWILKVSKAIVAPGTVGRSAQVAGDGRDGEFRGLSGRETEFAETASE